MMVAVAFMDPANYSTAVTGGAQNGYALLFVILLSTLLALYLQALSLKLGSVTGHDLAANCRQHLPFWVSAFLYVIAEGAIMATDVAEIIGTAVALNILLHIPLMAGLVLTIVDVLIVLLAYRPGTGMLTVRIFEYGITVLVMVVVVCFAVEAARIPTVDYGAVFKGYLPTNALLQNGALYNAAGILGAVVMPHSLYLGSSIVKPRIWDFDLSHGYVPTTKSDADYQDHQYTPSLQAIRWAYRYSMVELFVALSTVAIFVNSAILIVAGDTMYNTPAANDASLYSIYDSLVQYVGKGAAVVFMVSLLSSGEASTIICTMAGQIVCEGHINWKVRPWIRRLVTRGIAIIPCLAVVGALGEQGLAAALNGVAVALTISLPIIVAPLVYLTSKKSVMTVKVKSYEPNGSDISEDGEFEGVNMANSWWMMALGFAIWLFLTIMNIYLIVMLGLGQ
jgi:metal iron transporter